ncbi:MULTISPECIES: PDR/VanB family oxidoreductase [Pseudomonas]|jgi:ferredoxin-NADP reductase|uniref:PDR/VanB family oxidoreductase n=1 Tax=Pseudomonas TaxID=286 RepID=UPI0008382F76|nr:MULTISPECIES: PDR/VanB family oxidoreductase [Pseudomonas]QIH07455.1 oxidoreductase [Pseudomonas sp. BIOMIG1BAC]
MNNFINVRVKDVRVITPVIREFTFEPTESKLPTYSAGSHIQVHIPLEERSLRNAYSLVGDPAQCDTYRIAVRLQSPTRGGSAYMHSEVKVGDMLRLTKPANLFPIHSQGRHHVLIAGGIGITPFLSYIEHLLAQHASFELHYAYRKGLTDAYLDHLQGRLGNKLNLYESLERPLDVATILRDRPLGCHLYTCGPERLINSVQEQASNIGWPSGRIHWEAFSSAEAGQPFSVKLARGGQILEVKGDESLLEALEAQGFEIPNMCRGGVCGQCVTRFLDGDVDHRDNFLTSIERSGSLMPCVSRGCGNSLVIDL